MTLTRNDFKGLLDSVDQLEARRKRIEELRQTYIEALQKDDAAKQSTAIEEAAKEGVELFQHLPLSELREVEQVRKLAGKLAENKGVLADGKTLVALKDVNVDDLLKKLGELERVIQQLKTALSAAEPVKTAAETGRKQLADLSTALEMESVVLERLLAKASAWQAHARVRDALLRLNTSSFKDYALNAAQWLDDAVKALQLLPASSDEQQVLGSQVTKARTQHNFLAGQWNYLEVKPRLEQLEVALDAGQKLPVEDLTWLNSVVQGAPDLPPPLTRLLARASQAAPAQAAGFGEISTAWWGQWQRIAGHTGNNAFSDKRGLLDKLDKEIADPKSSADWTGADRDLWRVWRGRISQAQEMVESLKWYLSTPAPSFEEQHYDSAWRTLGHWLEHAPDEVFCLFADEWLTAHKMMGDWDEAIIQRRIARERRAKQQALAEALRLRLGPGPESEKERAGKKQKRGLALIRQMAAPPPAGPQMAPAAAPPPTSLSYGTGDYYGGASDPYPRPSTDDISTQRQSGG